MRAILGNLLIFSALAACGKGTPAPASAPIDASPVAAFAPLVGSWTGSVYLSSIGTASGIVNIGSRGSGHYVVTTAAGSQNGQLQILSLSDTHIRGRSGGYERTLPVKIEGNRMRIEVPQVGPVVLTRSVSSPKAN